MFNLIIAVKRNLMVHLSLLAASNQILKYKKILNKTFSSKIEKKG